MAKIAKTDEQWRQILTPLQYDVTRRHGTERAFSGELYHTKKPGTYHCVCCGHLLFDASAKYDSGSGWPSFFQPVSTAAVAQRSDASHGMVRVEVTCPECDAHLGHVFDDGPQPTGRRYCMNSAALRFADAEGTDAAEPRG